MTLPRRALIVEDEMLVSMLLEDSLTALGVEVAGTAGTLDEALVQANNGHFDCAILDVRLHGKDIFPVADALAGRGIPFVFSTGYGQSGLPEKYRDRPVLQKPFMPNDLERALSRL